MRCYNCNATLSEQNFCTSCGVDVSMYKKIMFASNALYNEGLDKARVRDLTGAVICLRQSLKFNKANIEARNLLGLVYFEMGEVVAALSEWVISKNIRPGKNIANTYIEMIQTNTSKLDVVNQSIKKYNQALAYAEQDSLDLAVIQLKKVLSMNPKFLRAHELLALLYINGEEWERAKRELDKCLVVDKGNTLCMRYMLEVEKMLIPDETGKTPVKKNSDEAVRYKSDNEIIIQPGNVKEPHSGGGVGVLLYILVGIAIGALAVFFLIRPGIIASEKEKAQADARMYGEELDAKTAEITSLESEIKSLTADNDDLHGQLDAYLGEGGTMETVNRLLEASGLYIEDPTATEEIQKLVEEIAEEVDFDSASESFTQLYQALLSVVGPQISAARYEAGYAFFGNEDYALAITELEKAVFFDENNADALFMLGNAYRRAGNDEKAKECYALVMERFPGTERAGRAEGYIAEIGE